MEYVCVFISAEDMEQADVIRDALLEKKLIVGGPVLSGPAKFWWKGEIVEMDYCYIMTYTKPEYKEQIIEAVERVAEEEVPMVSFVPFEGNKKLEELIDKTLE